MLELGQLVMMQWAAGIRRLRQSNGWKQTTLAEMIGVDQATVSRWERGLQTPELSVRKCLVELMRRRVPELDRLQMLSVEASPNLAVAFDRDFRVIAVSEAAAALFGTTPSVLVGEVLPVRRSPDLSWARDRAEECGLWRGEVAVMRFVACLADAADGVARHAQVAWTPVFVGSGDVVVCAQMREIDGGEYRRAIRTNRLSVVAMEDLAVA